MSVGTSRAAPPAHGSTSRRERGMTERLLTAAELGQLLGLTSVEALLPLAA